MSGAAKKWWHGTPIVQRPTQHFSHLDPVYQWEFTRRHPYYLKNWSSANEYWRYQANLAEFQSLDSEKKERLHASYLLLVWIGAIGSEYPDPANDARRDSDFKPPFNPPLVRTLSHRDWLFNALFFLPPDIQKAAAAAYLRQISQQEATETPPGSLVSGLEDELIAAFCYLPAPELDKQFPGMLYYNCHAPIDELVKQFKDIVRQSKEAIGVKDTRRRQDKWDDYLKVWDHREGWSSDHYDGHKEMRLRDVSKELGVGVPTLQKHHASAFKLITGHDYDPELWTALFCAMKFEDSKWRNWRKGKARSAGKSKSATASSSSSDSAKLQFGEGFQNVATSRDDWKLAKEFEDCRFDIESLVAKNRTNEEIAFELDIETESVEYFRSRNYDEI